MMIKSITLNDDHVNNDQYERAITSNYHRSQVTNDDLINSTSLRISTNYTGRIIGFYVSQISLIVVSCIYMTVIVVNLISNFNGVLSSKNPLYRLDGLIILVLCFAVIFLIHGNFCQRNYDLYLYFFNMALVTYFIWLDYTWTSEQNFLDHIEILVGLVSLPIIGILIIINRKMFNQFNIIGASPSIISMYKTYCYFHSLIKCDLQNMIIMAMFMFATSNHLLLNLITFGALLIYSVLMWVITKIAVCKELKPMVYCFVGLSLIGLSAIPLQIYDLSCFQKANCSNDSILISFSILGVGLAAIIIKIWVYIELLAVYRNFGFGLTDSAFITLANHESTSLLYGIGHSVVNYNPIVIS